MEYRTLEAGDLTCEYAGGKLRYIRLGSTELIRGIYFAVRDSDWGTLPLRCLDEQLAGDDEEFTLTFKSVSTENAEAVVEWECSVQGHKNNKISFGITGTFTRDYISNRTGFCLLHPLKHLVGQSFDVQNPAGLWHKGTFPRLIAPHQPATNIGSLAWKTANGIECRLTFEGEVFEMEDQRNWTDASFKTYCSPLKNGWPKTYHKGDIVSQKIVFQLLSHEQQGTPDPLPANSLSYDTRLHFPWPGIGSRIPNIPLEQLNAKKIATLPLSLLRADVIWGGSAWEYLFTTAIDYAKKCGKPLHLVLHYAQGDLPALVNTLCHLCRSAVIEAISVVWKDRIVAEPDLVLHAHQLIRQCFPAVKIGVGTPYLFTQFNRTLPHTGLQADFVFFGNNPQVHAFDESSIIETIEGQAETLKSARALAPNLPIHVSPIALNPPFSPDKLPREGTPRETLTYDSAPDRRQGSPFTAGWMLGCLAALATEGAHQLDFFETEGDRGLIIDQKPTPAFAVLDRLLNRRPIRLFSSQSSNPLKFNSLGIHTSEGTYLYVVNHTDNRLSLTADDSWLESAILGPENDYTGFSDATAIPENKSVNIAAYGIMEILLKKESELDNLAEMKIGPVAG